MVTPRTSIPADRGSGLSPIFGILIRVAAAAPDDLLERLAAKVRESGLRVHQFVWSQLDASDEARVLLEVRQQSPDREFRLMDSLRTLPGVRDVANLDAEMPARRT